MSLRIETGALRVVDELHAATSISERGRTLPIGEWEAVPYDGDNFSNFSGGAETIGGWGVGSGDIGVNRVMTIGKTMWWSLQVATSSVLASSDHLRAYLPNSRVVSATGAFVPALFVDAGSSVAGRVIPVAGTGYVRIDRNDGVAMSSATNTTWVYFSIFVEFD